jgi:PAS domain S-box-containing protein
MKVRLYVTAVALVAAAVAAYAATTVTTPARPPVAALVLFAVLITLAESLQIRHHHHDEVDALIVMEGMLAPLVLVAPGLTVVLVAAAALTVGDVVRRNPPLKVLFNVSQWVLAASTASVVLQRIRPHDLLSGGSLGALVLAMLLMSAINQVAMAGVLFVVAGSPIGSRSRDSWRGVVAGHLISITGGIAAGICLSAAYLWSPWTLVIGIVVVIGSHSAGRAVASLHADGVRLAALQSATHALAASIDVASGLPAFLAEARTGFEVQEAELVLFSERGATVHSCTAASDDGYAVCVRRHELAEALAARLIEPTRYAAGDGTDAGAVLAGTEHTRVIAAPLRSGGTTIGVLFLYDRIGMEGFEAGELKIADALAREVVGFLERVTLLQAIDEERRKLADILGSTSDGIFSLEADGTITSWNAGLAAMTGYDAEEIVGTRHFGLLRPRDAQGRDVYVERWADLINTPAGLPTDIQIVSQAGELVWLSCSFSPIPAKEPGSDSLVVVARNVTQVRELEKLKDDFVAVVSHELRTPLVPIKGWAQTLLNRGDRLNDDQRRTAVQSILAQAQKLESLVLNILEASRIEAGRTDGDGVADVVGIAARIVEDTVASRPDRTLRLRPPSVPCNVKGSAVWVERAVANLIANAIKYSPDDEPVDVFISTEGDDVLVAVTDRGPGIAVDAQERIFDRFERLEETRKQTGTGLGLYITRRMARTMGGDVTVSSVPGAGSTFLLRLPVAPISATATTRLPDQRAAEPEERSNVVQLH